VNRHGFSIYAACGLFRLCGERLAHPLALEVMEHPYVTGLPGKTTIPSRQPQHTKGHRRIPVVLECSLGTRLSTIFVTPVTGVELYGTGGRESFFEQQRLQPDTGTEGGGNEHVVFSDTSKAGHHRRILEKNTPIFNKIGYTMTFKIEFFFYPIS
jgi:hypothetical protein